MLVIDMRLAGKELPQPAQRTGDVEKGPFRMVRLFAEQGLGVALLGGGWDIGCITWGGWDIGG